MDNLRGLLIIKRIDRVLNPQIRELCRMMKGVIEVVLHWFGQIEGMENDRTAERLYVGVCG